MGGLKDHPWKPAYGPNDRPLEAFYLPALSRAVRYDRIAGFFSSDALAAAAQGVARLVARGGRMRLLVGARLDPEDVAALLRGVSLEERLKERFLGVLEDPQALADALVRARLEVLAWLAAQGRLEVRVVVEADPQTGRPVASGGYFHAKGGVFWDEEGNGLAFVGSINETAAAWRLNYESFHVFCSWRDPEHFRFEVERFERLWADAEPGWRVVALPEAVRRELVRLAPAEPPAEEPAVLPSAPAAKGRWLVRFARDAPYLVHKGWRVGVETAAVRPFPHQRMVAYDILERFPCRRLLADEVGLGKTIEAGFVLRSLLLSGRIRRCLLIVPRGLVRQWQEELRERFCLDVPFYDGSRFVWVGNPQDRVEEIPEGTGPWEVHPVVIVSAQQVRRPERARSLLEAPPWDLIIVDEAHHARRRDFLDLSRYRPNRLLVLLEELAKRTQGLLLLTATPMQVHPVEAWDLLRLLGLPDRWQNQESFIAYFQELAKPPEEMDWGTLLPMVQAAVRCWGWDERWEAEAEAAIGPVAVLRLKSLIKTGQTGQLRALIGQERRWLVEALRRHTPPARLMYRHTRSLLREYHRWGLVKDHVPERRPEPVWLNMSEDERTLYEQVEDYVSEFYRRYESQKKGLGFVMRVYRQRLTSSLYALRRSLERRREFLLGRWRDEERPAGLEPEDLEEAELEEDLVEELGRPPGWEEELRELDRLLERLKLAADETKPAALDGRLKELLKGFDQVLVFTQYTDTLDFLRDRLRPSFGSALGCYSGRGGEVWDWSRGEWVLVSKLEVQRRFEQGELKVLLCTEAAGEGLNLQTCGAVINYDMPWNPMRVEQRIGRIDRLGQRRREVVVLHFFYRGTVEARVYEALARRIGWFEAVVGELQPILRRAYTAIRQAAMERPKAREEVLERELEALATEKPLPSLEGWQGHLQGAAADAPLTSEDLASLLPIQGVSAGEPSACLWSELPDLGPPPSRPGLVRLERVKEGIRWVGYYHFQGGTWCPVTTFRRLAEVLDLGSGEPADIAKAEEQFEQDIRRAGRASG